ncbi:unnamed protein product [Moneuplotes crassus]|uniref:Uncharacterized protein n=1 Tax=Euplotes crassus TaxID=5936 RepID=A0AAD1XST9_EUPCR|nr:unnamed protein product [Moneuplotes crassus]
MANSTKKNDLFPSRYGRGRGIKNTDYGIVQISKNGDILKDWKHGSLMRTSSEHRVNYLDNQTSLFPEIRKDQSDGLSAGRTHDYRMNTTALNTLKISSSSLISPVNSTKGMGLQKGYYNDYLSTVKSYEKKKVTLKIPVPRTKVGPNHSILDSEKPNYSVLRSPVQFRNIIAVPIEDHKYNPYLSSHYRSPSY